MLGIYVRQSKEKKTKGSIKDQESKGIEYANYKGLDYLIYKDEGITASSDNISDRPGLEALLNDVSKGLIKEIFVMDESRLTRNEQTKLIIKTIVTSKNVVIWSALEGKVNLNSPEHEFMSTIRLAMNIKHIRDMSIKIKSVLKNRAIEGKGQTGPYRPLGYTLDADKYLIIDCDEAEIVKRIYTLYIEGYGDDKIARILNSEGIPTKSSKVLESLTITDKVTNQSYKKSSKDIKWSGKTINGILQNSIYIGKRKYKDIIIDCPQIIDEDTWNKAQDIRKGKSNRNSIRKYNYLLRHKIKCGVCGRNMTGKTREDKKDHFYYCTSKVDKKNSCRNRSINIDKIESIVWTYCLNSLSNFRELDAIMSKSNSTQEIANIKKKLSVIENKIGALNRKLENLAILFSESKIDMNLYDKLYKSHKKEEQELFDSKEILKKKLAPQLDEITLGEKINSYFLKYNSLIKKASFKDRLNVIRNVLSYVVVTYHEDTKTHTIDIFTNHKIDKYLFEVQGKPILPFIKDYKNVNVNLNPHQDLLQQMLHWLVVEQIRSLEKYL